MSSPHEVAPPRFWWLKRLAAAYALGVVAVASLTGAWAWRADVALRSLRDEWRAEGAPATVDEINALGLPYDARAEADGRTFRAAAATLRSNTFVQREHALRSRHEAISPREPIALRDVNLVRRSVNADAASLAILEPLLDGAANGRPLDFGVRFRSPMIGVLLPHLNDVRQAGDALNEAARLRHADGDHAAAVETVGRMLTLDREIARPPAVLVMLMIARQMDADACDAIETMAGALVVADAVKSTTPAATTPAATTPAATTSAAATVPTGTGRAAVARLIAALLDDDARRESLRGAFEVDRVMLSDSVEHSTSVTQVAPLHRRAFRFGYRVSADAYFSPALRACAAPDRAAAEAVGWPAITDPPPPPPRPAAKPTPPPRPSRLLRNVRTIAEFVHPSLRSTVRSGFDLATRRRACATLLAIRLFELDHGRVPDRLDELVPAYLPEVPRDSTRASGPPLTYVNEPAGAGQPALVGLWISDPRHPTSRPATRPTDARNDRPRRQHVWVVYRGHERVRQQ